MAHQDHLQHGHEEHGVPLLPPEQRDAGLGIIVKTSLGLLSLLFLCIGIAKLHYDYEMSQQPKAEPTPFSTAQRLPPEPRLQAFPSLDLTNFKETQGHVADTYGWVDKAAGVARVPVEKAIDMVLEKGFPPRTPETEKVALAAALKAATAKAAAEAKAGPKPEAKK